ncbi:cereblon family protein [Candidatus Albibeggiatoa sp. nov. BB20]|uniref:cereblon family protein n=1 Tax=Candidatus Albibeggiatoa sp. nov. BB20 TaxID=3162723 RepID=UPI00336584DF
MSQSHALYLSPWMYFQESVEIEKKRCDTYQQDTASQKNDNESHKILCRYCKHPITNHQHKIEIQGKHQHYLTNPDDIHFEVGCFSQAQGCATSGQPTLEHTWFHQYYWSYALCQHCHTHLGWYYRNGSHRFYGLMLNALLDE